MNQRMTGRCFTGLGISKYFLKIKLTLFCQLLAGFPHFFNNWIIFH